MPRKGIGDISPGQEGCLGTYERQICNSARLVAMGEDCSLKCSCRTATRLLVAAKVQGQVVRE